MKRARPTGPLAGFFLLPGPAQQKRQPSRPPYLVRVTAIDGDRKRQGASTFPPKLSL